MTAGSQGGSAGKMADLGPRLVSGIVLAVLGLGVIWAGGVWLTLAGALIAAIMVWELARLCGAPLPLAYGACAGICALGVLLLPDGHGLPLLLLPAFAAVRVAPGFRTIFAIFAAVMMLAVYGLVHVRDDFGAGWMAWLILVVIVTDVAGYFAGRLIGGPKFWPRVSPKKTWSGTAGGWIGAALVGAGAWWVWGTGSELISLSVVLSMASQLGDVAESALKRRAGVKDSSNLLPGHGGLFDRFDGLLGAVVLFLMIEQAVAFPPGPMGG